MKSGAAAVADAEPVAVLVGAGAVDVAAAVWEGFGSPRNLRRQTVAICPVNPQ